MKDAEYYKEELARKAVALRNTQQSTMFGMDAVVAVAIAVLTIVFLGSLVALIVVCRHKYCRRMDLLSRTMTDNRPDVHLISSDDMRDLELDDVRLHPDIEKILTDDQWVDDATGLIPHCLAILKKCHHLTERLVAMTMTSIAPQTDHQLWEIIEVAKKISPRVDDVVRSMYPPLDPRLLEARVTALILSVMHLAFVTRSVCQISSTPGWIEEALADMEEHVHVLKDAGMSLDVVMQGQQSVNGTAHPITDAIPASSSVIEGFGCSIK